MSRIESPAYFASADRPMGPVRYRQLPGAIGIASEVGQNGAGMAVWMLQIHGVNLPGRWVIVDRRLVLEPGSA